MAKEKEKPKCDACGSSQVYTRVSTAERVCRVCGAICEIRPKKKAA